MRVSLQPAFIIHRRPYRDTSLLLEVFSAEYGRISLVARGARRKARGGSGNSLLQSFVPLLLSFAGRTELKSLAAAEAAGPALQLRGQIIFSGLYVNELLIRLLHRHDPHPQLFAAYGQALERLSVADTPDAVLRHFEFTLLQELGYGFELSVDGRSGEPVQADCWYQYHPDCGVFAHQAGADQAQPVYVGADLLAMSAGEFGGGAQRAAKHLLRQALAGLLGDAPLRSRDLFRASITAGGGPGAALASGEDLSNSEWKHSQGGTQP